MAEGVLRRYLEEAGLAERVATDSAGTHGYHVGEPPDPRAQRAAGRRGYDISGLRGRQVQPADFSEFDYVLAMDEANLRALARICPPEHAEKLRLFMEFAPDGAPREVPDPYYGGPQGFERVLDQLEQAARGLIEHLRARIGA